MDITDVTNLLTAASTPSNAIAAIAGVVLEGEKIADTELTQKILHQYDDELHETINTGVTLLSGKDSTSRADDLAAFTGRVFADAGIPFIGGVEGASGELIVSVAFVLAAITAAGQVKRDNAILNQLAQSAAQGKLNNPTSVPAK